MIHTRITPDGVIHFPPAAERARLRSLSAASHPGDFPSPGAPAPAADPEMSDMSPAAGAFSSPELPLAAFDRPLSDPEENAGGEGEAPPPVPVSNGVPVTPAAEFPALPGTAPGGSIASVLQKRMEHIALGYTPEHDAALPEPHLAHEARNYAGDAIDLIKRHDEPARIRLKLINACALLLAAIDSHDHRHPPENPDALP